MYCIRCEASVNSVEPGDHCFCPTPILDSYYTDAMTFLNQKGLPSRNTYVRLNVVTVAEIYSLIKSQHSLQPFEERILKAIEKETK